MSKRIRPEYLVIGGLALSFITLWCFMVVSWDKKEVVTCASIGRVNILSTDKDYNKKLDRDGDKIACESRGR